MIYEVPDYKDFDCINKRATVKGITYFGKHVALLKRNLICNDWEELQS